MRFCVILYFFEFINKQRLDEGKIERYINQNYELNGGIFIHIARIA